MRIPGRKIWRAFRELDEFSDEQCRRFVKRAWGGSAQRVLAAVMVIGTFAATAFVAGWALISVYEAFDFDNRKVFSDTQITLISIAMVVVIASVGPLMALIVRDVFLRALIWRVLNIGGVCGGCGYPLYGLPLTEALGCSCPECGTETTVERTLVELTRNESGQTVASKRSSGDQKHFWTTRKLRNTGRLLFTVFVVVFVLPVAALFVNELIVQVEAARARAKYAGVDEYEKAFGVRPTVRTGGEKREIPGSEKAEVAVSKLLDEVRQAGHDAPARMAIGDAEKWEWVGKPGPGATDAEQTQANDYQWRVQELRRFMAELDKRGLRDVFREAAKVEPEKPWVLEVDRNGRVEMALIETNGKAFSIAVQRMRLAAEDGDTDRFEESLGAALALMRARAADASWWSWWINEPKERALWRALREAIATRPEWAQRARELVEATVIRANSVRQLELARLAARNHILSVIGDASAVRFNRFTPGLSQQIGSVPPGRVGWVGENINAVNREFDLWRKVLEADPWNRPTVAGTATDLLLVASATTSMAYLVESADNGNVVRSGMRVWLAIEEFEEKNGRLPVKLEELDLPREALVDPLSGKLWGYVASPDAATLGAVRPAGGFLLYSLGIDATDDFAATGDFGRLGLPKTNFSGGRRTGHDLLINK